MFVPLELNQGNFNRFAAGSGSSSVYTVNTLADLKALTTRPTLVQMLGSVTVSDGLGGPYRWVAGDTSTADDITVVTPTSGTAGRYILLSERIGTLAPYPTTSTNSGTAKAIDALQYASGTVTGPTNLNSVKIFSDAINATNSGGPDYFINGFAHEHYFGGSTVRGGRQGLASYLYLTGATNSGNDNHNYVGLAGIATANAADGGTNPAAAGTSKGAIFGGGLVGVLSADATAMLNVTGCEFNTAMKAGSSSWSKTLAQFSGRDDDAASGSGIDAMLWLYQQSLSSIKWDNGILFDNGGGFGNFPFDTNSTVLKVSATTGTPTIGTGIDLSALTITTAAFMSPGFTVDGSGTITSNPGTITTSTPGLVVGQTWNNAATIFKSIVVNLTNTNSAVTSRVLDFVVGGSSAFSVDALGQTRGSNFLAAAGNQFQWVGRSILKSSADGIINVFFADGTTYSAFNAGEITAMKGTAVGAGASTQAFVKGSSTANLGVYYGTGDPTFSAAKGSLYTKTDATTAVTRLWVNTNGSTTWTFFTSAA